jgi:hypothetical protein
MNPVSRVQQEQRCGCTVAAVAMVVGKTYRDVLAYTTRDFDNDGAQLEDWFDYLFDHGFCFHRVYRVTHLQGTNKPREVWPPLPFAPLHLCSVMADKGSHAVVMLDDGSVLDPAREGRYTLSGYAATSLVLGLFRRDGYAL